MSANPPFEPPTGPAADDDSKAQQVGATAKHEGEQLAQSVAQEAQSVGETVQEQAARVADDVAVHTRDLVGKATAQVSEQAEQQTHKLADVLRSAGDQARALSEGRTEDAGEIDRYVRQVAGTLSQIAERIDSLGARGSVEEVQRFARRRPGAFLAGAAVAGFVASRFARNVGEDGSAGQGGSRQSPQPLPASTVGTTGPGLATRVPPPPTSTPPAPPPPVTGSGVPPSPSTGMGRAGTGPGV